MNMDNMVSFRIRKIKENRGKSMKTGQERAFENSTIGTCINCPVITVARMPLMDLQKGDVLGQLSAVTGEALLQVHMICDS